MFNKKLWYMNNEHVYYLNGKQVVPKDYNAQREITLTLVRYKAEYVKAFCETVHFDPYTGQIIHTLNAETNID